MGENHFESMPVALYGFILLMAAIAYYMLQDQIKRKHGKDSVLAKALGGDLKGKISPVLYIIAIPTAFYAPIISGLLYVFVALIWLIPDKRIEKTLEAEKANS